MKLLYRCCAGLDIHRDTVSVCIRRRVPGQAAAALEEEVFGTFTQDLERLRSWLKKHKVRQAAMESVWIPPGKFMMGCSPGDSECDDDEKLVHEVSLSHGFWMGEMELTQAAYKAVTGKPNPSRFKGGDLPVEQVTWRKQGPIAKQLG